MLGLYVHIPFCARRCPYCDFAIFPGAGKDMVASYVQALQRELHQALTALRCEHSPREFTSIFFGGGTPSFLDADDLASVMKTIRQTYPIAVGAEVTLEANPEDATPEKLSVVREAGWNRISYGAQSFAASELKLLGRRHDGHSIEDAVAVSRAAGFENISLDLIYATPGQTTELWGESLARAVALDVEHISCYSLTIEDGTNFGRRAAQGTLLPMADDDQATMMQLGADKLVEAGYERYEISNYARPGYRSIHNENYWRGGDYLACGNGAHGHCGGIRWWNERDPRRYIELMEEQGSARAGEEHLTPRQRMDELVMLGLRTREGVCLDEVSRTVGLDVGAELQKPLENLRKSGLLEYCEGVIRLSPQAFSIADAVTVRLLG